MTHSPDTPQAQTAQADKHLIHTSLECITQILTHMNITAILAEVDDHTADQFKHYLIAEVRIKLNQLKHQLIIHLPSAGLTIDQKAALEDHLKQHPKYAKLRQLITAHNLKIKLNFTKATNQPSPLSPSPASPRKHHDHLDAPSRFMVTDSPKRPLPDIGAIYCVASGKGGVGKSTVAAHLCRVLAQMHCKVGLLDADIHGPSAPELLGIQDSLTVTADHKVTPLVNHGVKCVSFGFLSDSYHPAMWRGPLISKALQQFIFDVNWGKLDMLIIDLPPGTGDIPMTMAESIAIDGCIIVSTAHPIALSDAHKAISMFYKLAIPITGVIGNMIHYSCTSCSHHNYVFGDPQNLIQMCEQRSTPLLGQLPLIAENPKLDLTHLDSHPTDPNRQYLMTLQTICQTLTESTSSQ